LFWSPSQIHITMGDLLASLGCFKRLFAGLSVIDASAVLTSTLKAHDAAKEYHGALIFWFSRPAFDPGMSVQAAQKVWKACAESLVACDLPPGLWLHAEHVRCVNPENSLYSYWERESGRKFLSDVIRFAQDPEDPDVSCVQDARCTMTANYTVSSVLMLDSLVRPYARGHYDCHYDYYDQQNTIKVVALVSDCEGRFALVNVECLDHIQRSIPRRGVQGIVFLHGQDLSSLIQLVEDTNGEEVRWLLKDDYFDSRRKYLALGLTSRRWMDTARYIKENYTIPSMIGLPDKADWDALCDKLEKRLASAWPMCKEHALAAEDHRSTTIGESESHGASERVIQTIEHHEPPAFRDPSMLDAQANSQWVDDVACCISSNAGTLQCEDGDVQARDVLVLRFGSPASGGDGLHRFRTILKEGPQLRVVRVALQDAGFPCQLTCGALMFVEPGDAPDVLRALEGHSLCPYHIVVDASLEYLLDEILSGFSFQKRPKRKSGASGRRSLCWEDSQASNFEDSSTTQTHDPDGFQSMVFVEERTFLSWKPMLKAASTVIQSTTEAASSQSKMYFGNFKGFNPRRFV